MTFTEREEKELGELLNPLLEDQNVLRMKGFIQHGQITTYDHCEKVAQTCFWLTRRLGLKLREKELIRAAMLHDFFLYDWHQAEIPLTRPFEMHGYTHPGRASKNAARIMHAGRLEQDIIESHMWPLTLLHPPKSREAWVVCMADKYCSARETLLYRRKRYT